MKYGISMDTPVGVISIAEDGVGICDVYFGKLDAAHPDGSAGRIQEKETLLLAEARRQLTEYFAGERQKFSLPLSLHGTEFQKKDWQALMEIPYGETRSYKQIAEMLGNPRACRAVGMANNRNRIAILIPCHRVIGSDGAMVGYAGGVEHKVRLLAMEKQNSSVQSFPTAEKHKTDKK